jgi:hypothetical protein
MRTTSINSFLNQSFGHSIIAKVSAISLVLLSAGCASNASNSSSANVDTSKAEQKISMAIGQEVGQFSITGQQKIDAPMGQNGAQYAVQTKAGKSYKCDIYEPSGFGNVVMWGGAVGSSAMCTDFTKGSADAGKTNAASCNALLKAAGRC